MVAPMGGQDVPKAAMLQLGDVSGNNYAVEVSVEEYTPISHTHGLGTPNIQPSMSIDR
jgi:hypothetical protein